MRRWRWEIVVAALVLAGSQAPAQDAIWQADFSAANAGFKPYHAKDAETTLKVEELEGVRVLSAETPGKRALEGVCANGIRGLPAGRLCTFAAEVRGQGYVWLMAYSSNGWLYSPQTVKLRDEWKKIRLTKPLGLDNTTVNVCLLTREVGKMRLEVKSLRAYAEEAPQTWDRAVAPVRFEAEEFCADADKVVEGAGRSGGDAVSDARYFLLKGIPCPRTSRPIHVFLRVKMPESEGYFSIMSSGVSGSQRLNRMQGELTKGWQWVSDKALGAAMVGNTFNVAYYGPKEPKKAAVVDAVVITTEADPTAEELDNAHEVRLTGEPCFGVGRVKEPPVLDGHVEERCWQRTPILTDFVTVGACRRAEQQSEMRFCYDEENLYWFFRGEQWVLEKARQQLHEFKKNVTERDGKVWHDDCVLLLADPGGEEERTFDVFVNALGTVADSRMSGENLWGSRAVEFDADVEAVCRTDEGYWTVEARMSFEGLGVKPPEAGDSWRVIVGRILQAQKETSSWNLCGIGFHDTAAFARMEFLEAGASVVVKLPERLQLGDNELGAEVITDSPESGHYMFWRLADKAGTAGSWAFCENNGPIVTSVVVSREGETKLSYGVLDAVTLRPVLISPQYPRSVKSSVAEVRIESAGPYRLYVNGVQIAAGESGKRDDVIKAFLQKGVNAFGLALDKGVADVEIEAGGMKVTERGKWRLAPAEVEDFSGAKVDAREWAVTPAQEGEGGRRLIGKAEGASRMRLTVLWEDTRIFPNSQPAFYVCRGTNQHLTVVARGLPGHRLEGYRCHLALPAELELVGVTGYYGVIETQPHFTIEAEGEVEYDGVKYRHYTVVADKAIRYRDKVRILELFNVFVRYDEAAGEPEDRAYRLYYGIEALDGNIVEVMRPLAIRILPKPEGKQPSKLVWQLWGSFFGAMNRGEMKAATLETMREAGFNNMVSGELETSELGDGLGIDNVMGINFAAWSINMEPWLAENPDKALVDKDGKASKQFACTSAVLNEAYPYIDTDLKGKIADRHCDYVDWDYESGVMTGYLSCFCPRCLTAFRKYADIGDDVGLSPQTIEEEHLEKWTGFMNLRMAQLARKFKDTCHGAEPPARFSVYSGYQSEDTKWRYGVNWELIGELEAVDHAACGYGRNYQTVRATVKALKGIPLVCGQIMSPYDRNSDNVLWPLTRAVLLRRLFDSTGGLMVYDSMPVGGRSWQASADVSRLAAEYEDVFLKGDFVAVEGVAAEVDWLGARKHEGTLLVAVMNLTSQEKQYGLTMPQGYKEVREFYSGKPLAGGEKVEVTLAAGEALVYVLSE